MKNKYSAEQHDKNHEEDRSGKTAWRCEKCGQIHYSDEPPDECPYCLFPNKPFKKVGSEE